MEHETHGTKFVQLHNTDTVFCFHKLILLINNDDYYERLELTMPSKIILFTTFVLTSAFSLARAQNSSLSALCLSQIEVLAANTTLVEAVPSQECMIEEGKNSCTVDYDPYQTTTRTHVKTRAEKSTSSIFYGTAVPFMAMQISLT
jgi:hypothetical protein